MRGFVRTLLILAFGLFGLGMTLHIVFIDLLIYAGFLFMCYPNPNGPGLVCATVTLPELLLKTALATGSLNLAFELSRGNLLRSL